MRAFRKARFWADRQVAILVAATLGLVGFGTVFYSVVEGWSVLDAMYFSIVSLLTVGLGDIAPATPVGRAFTIVFLLCGVGLATTVIRIAVRRTARHTLEGT